MRARSTQLVAGALFLSTAITAQQDTAYIPVDFVGEPGSEALLYLPNEGQLADVNGDLVPSVLIYTMRSSPQLFLERGATASFAYTKIDTAAGVSDSTWRWLLEFVGENVDPDVSPKAFNSGTERFNYYLAHCTQGIMDVSGHRRIVFEDVYPNVDVHFYSNAQGAKIYIVIRPGGDPDDIRMQLSGQDSLHIDPDGYLRAYMQDKWLILPEALAYQEINGAPQLVNYGLDYQDFNGNGQVGFDWDTYDSDYPLILDISFHFNTPPDEPGPCPDWSTYFGDVGADYGMEIVAISGDTVAVGGLTMSAFLPVLGAADGNLDGTQDCWWGLFGPGYEHLYSTYYGGEAFENSTSIAVSAARDAIYLSCISTSQTLTLVPSGQAFFDNSFSQSNGVVARFSLLPNPGVGTAEWITLFGATELAPDKIECDAAGNVYLVGEADFAYVGQVTCSGTNGTFPLCNNLNTGAYQQVDFNGGFSDGFVAIFGPSHELLYTTLFGGEGTDHLTDIAIDNVHSRFFIVGATTSKRFAYNNCEPPIGADRSFPLCNSGGGFFDDDINANNTNTLADGYMACFGLNGVLLHSTYIGSAGDETGQCCTVNETTGMAYFSGLTASTTYDAANCGVPTGLGFPNCGSGSQFHPGFGGGSDDAYIVKIDGQTFDLAWTSFIGGGITESIADLEINEQGDLVVGGGVRSGSMGTAPIPFVSNGDYYEQPVHADSASANSMTDGMILIFNQQDEMTYGSYMGGSGDGVIGDVASSGPSRLYVTGYSYSSANYPFRCPGTADPYCYLTYATVSSTASEVTVAQIRCEGATGIEQPGITSDQNDWTIIPNPCGDQLTFQAGHGLMPTDVRLSIFDLLGRQVVQEASPERIAERTATFGVGSVAFGFYMARLTSKDGLIDITKPVLFE